MHCILCYASEQRFYIYCRVNDKFEMVYCNSCANKSEIARCYMCGLFVASKIENILYGTYIRNRLVKGYMCQDCAVFFTEDTLTEKIKTPSYEMGIYCGYCHQKEARIYAKYVNSMVVRDVYRHYCSLAYGSWRDYYIHQRKFKILNGHKRLRCPIKCKAAKCKDYGRAERSGYCCTHMPVDKMRKDIFKTINNYINSDIAGLITSYVL